MSNNILVFRTDRIGDLLITCPAIVTIKKYFTNSKISIITSKKNYTYANDLKIFDEVYLFPNEGLLKKVKFIMDLSKKKFDYIFIFDGKERSIISSIFIKTNNKIAVKSRKKFDFFWKLIKIKVINDDEKTDLIKIYQKMLKFNNINVDIDNFNFLHKKKDNDFSSKIPINNYIHIHLDEKWFNHLYIYSYKKINPSYNDFIDFIKKSSVNNNIIITTGLIDFELVEKLKSNFFKKETEKIFYQANFANSIYLIYKPTINDLESILRKARILISCHGAITHIANSLSVKILDIIDESKNIWYLRFTSYLRKYTVIYRQPFSEIKNILLNKITNV